MNILKEESMKNLIRTIFHILSLHSSDPARAWIDWSYIQNLFLTVGVNINDFRTDAHWRFENMTLGKFIKMMFVYTIRFKQGACSACGTKVLDTMFGAIGFDSNHW